MFTLRKTLSSNSMTHERWKIILFDGTCRSLYNSRGNRHVYEECYRNKEKKISISMKKWDMLIKPACLWSTAYQSFDLEWDVKA